MKVPTVKTETNPDKGNSSSEKPTDKSWPQGLKIREIEERDNDITTDIGLNGIWKMVIKKLAKHVVQTKELIAIEVGIVCILYYLGINIIFSLVSAFVIAPFLVYMAIVQYFVKTKFYDDPTTLDIRSNMYRYWRRSDVPEIKLWIAEIDSEIVGCIAIRPCNLIGLAEDPDPKSEIRNKERAALERMYVSDKWRGKGIATILVRHALSFCKECGFREIELVTSSFQMEAQKLYRKFGFEVESTYQLCFGYCTVFNFLKKL